MEANFRLRTIPKAFKLHRKIRRGMVYGVIALGSFVVIANTVASQQMPPLLFAFADGGRAAVAGYLSRIKTLPIFPSELLRYKNEYGAKIQDDVFRADLERKEKIDAVTQALKKQPQSRDLLNALAQLYREDGNGKMAAFYEGKVKEIDPAFGN